MNLDVAWRGPWLPGVQEPWEWWWHPWWGLWGVGGIVVLVGMVLFWILVLIALLLGLRWLAAQGRTSRADPALEILRQRYARGEIDKDEFEAKKRDLLGG